MLLLSRASFLVALCCGVHPAIAQIYKCGSTWSQVPCGTNAEIIQPPSSRGSKEVTAWKSLPKPADLPATNETISRMSTACEQAARDRLKDPETARIKNIRRGGVETWCTKPPQAVRYYWMEINAKNSYGGYVGEKPYRCATDIQETVVLGIAQLGEGEALPASCSSQ